MSTGLHFLQCQRVIDLKGKGLVDSVASFAILVARISAGETCIPLVILLEESEWLSA
jgi:hypothetical protein